MASWNEIITETPDLAKKVEDAFAAHKHKLLATLRKDGSPRISGTEVEIAGGEMWLGSMIGSRKAKDLQRDPRFALHSAPIDVELQEATPDCKVAGRAVEITDESEKAAWVNRYQASGHEMPPGPFHLFRLDVDEVVCTWVAGDKMHVESFHEGRGTTHVERT
jgi:hypothetical protein